MGICLHKNSYYFHENAPKYCPGCDKFLNGIMLLEEQKIKLRKQKINKLITNI